MQPAFHWDPFEAKSHTRRGQRHIEIRRQRPLHSYLVMDQNMWSTLEQTNVNDLTRPFGIQFGDEGPDSLAGGHTKAGLITDKRLKISYHGARTVTGGTPFSFNDRRVLGQLEAAGCGPDRLGGGPA